MSRIAALLAIGFTGFFTLTLSAADPAAGWRGVKVIPKKVGSVRSENRLVDDKDFNLPFVVQDVKGDWLLVGEAKKGWIQRSAVVTINEAPAYFTQLIRQTTGNARAYQLRAIAWQEKGEIELAIADLREAIRLSPDPALYNTLGTLLIERGENDRAIENFNIAIRIDPEYWFAIFNRGNASRRKGALDEAILDYSEAIRLKPKRSLAYNNRGVVYKDKGDYKRAIEDYNQCLLLDPNYAIAYNNRAVARYLINDFDGAIADCNEAIRLDPNYATAFDSRADVWRTTQEFDKAVAD